MSPVFSRLPCKRFLTRAAARLLFFHENRLLNRLKKRCTDNILCSVLRFCDSLFYRLFRIAGRHEVGHAAQADGNGGKIVQHRGGRRHEDARNAQTDERTVEADNEAVVGVNAAHELLRDTASYHSEAFTAIWNESFQELGAIPGLEKLAQTLHQQSHVLHSLKTEIAARVQQVMPATSQRLN